MNRLISTGAAVALGSGLALGLAPSASAADCGTAAQDAVYETVPGTEAVYKTVTVIDAEAVPAVYEDVKVIDQEYVPGVPAVPGTEDTVVHHEAVTEVVHHDAEVVKEAYDEKVIDSPAEPGQHYSLKGNSGLDKDEVPPTPDEDPSIWQANTEHEPNGHYNSATDDDGTAYEDGESGLHFTSHGQYGEGKRDWFYFQAPVDEVSHIVHHEAEIKPAWDETVVVQEAYDEVVPGTPGTPAIPPVEEVSHIEHVLVTPAQPEKRHTRTVTVTAATEDSEVLVSEAVAATDACTATSLRLAQTGGEDIIPFAALGLILLFGGGGTVIAARYFGNKS